MRYMTLTFTLALLKLQAGTSLALMSYNAAPTRQAPLAGIGEKCRDETYTQNSGNPIGAKFMCGHHLTCIGYVFRASWGTCKVSCTIDGDCPAEHICSNRFCEKALAGSGDSCRDQTYTQRSGVAVGAKFMCGRNLTCIGYVFRAAWGKCKDSIPTPSPPAPPTPAPTCGGVHHPNAPYGRCSAWGDPHYTVTFTGARFDFMGYGPYIQAKSADGCFEVQSWHCPANFYRNRVPPVTDGSAVATFSGFAIKVGDNVAQMVGSSLYINGEEWPAGKPYPDNMAIRGSWPGNLEISLCGCGDTAGTIGYFNSRWIAHSRYGGNLGGYANMNVEITADAAEFAGTCAGEQVSAALACRKNLFTDAQASMLEEACGSCREPTPSDTPAPPPPPPNDLCAENGNELSDAEAACDYIPVGDNHDACILEYCVGGEVSPSQPNTPAPPTVILTHAPTSMTTAPTPRPPMPSLPTPAHTTPAPTTPCRDPGRGGTCTVVGDPHIRSFDGLQVSLVSMPLGNLLTDTEDHTSGKITDKWLVKSRSVSIQARFVESTYARNQQSFVRFVAVGGSFIDNNVLVIGTLEDDITWSGQPILEHQSSSFEFAHDHVRVKATRSEDSSNVADLSKESAGVSIDLPTNVSILVNRSKRHLNLAVMMTPREGGQDGLCGNYNGIGVDDIVEFADKRSTITVFETESLFSGLRNQGTLY